MFITNSRNPSARPVAPAKPRLSARDADFAVPAIRNAEEEFGHDPLD